MSIVRYRALRSSWGIAIDLVATRVEATRPPQDAVAIAEGVAVVITAPWLVSHERTWVEHGLRLMASRLRQASPAPCTVVVVSDLNIAPTDFQVEGLAAAMIQWAREELGLPAKDAVTGYDADAGRYVFDLEGAAA